MRDNADVNAVGGRFFAAQTYARRLRRVFVLSDCDGITVCAAYRVPNQIVSVKPETAHFGGSKSCLGVSVTHGLRRVVSVRRRVYLYRDFTVVFSDGFARFAHTRLILSAVYAHHVPRSVFEFVPYELLRVFVYVKPRYIF